MKNINLQNQAPTVTTTIQKQELRELPEEIVFLNQENPSLKHVLESKMQMSKAPINEYLPPIMQQQQQQQFQLSAPVEYIAPPMEQTMMVNNQYLAPQLDMPLEAMTMPQIRMPAMNYLPASIQNDVMMMQAMREQQPNYQQYQEELMKKQQQEQQQQAEMMHMIMMMQAKMAAEQQAEQQNKMMMLTPVMLKDAEPAHILTPSGYKYKTNRLRLRY